MGALDPFDQALQAKPPEVVGGLVGVVGGANGSAICARVLVNPAMTWSNDAIDASRAITRGSPKRSPGARWPWWTLGSTTAWSVATD